MFPNAQFLGMDIYYWMFLIGVLAAMAVGRVVADKVNAPAKVFNLSIISAVLSVVIGYLFSLLFESWYEYLEKGIFEWGTGSTFYGGLIGAALFFLILYFVGGRLFVKDKAHLKEFDKLLAIVFPCIVLAHAFGRLGCLFNGCCYGVKIEGFGGIDMYISEHAAWEHRVPLQLYEAIFLFILFGVQIFLYLKYKFDYNASLYLVGYGIWRFLIEFARDDERGASGIDALSPSQLTALILIAIGIGFFFLWKYFLRERFKTAGRYEQAE